MPLESKLTEEQLFDNLISSLIHSVWVSLGKIKNPMSDKIERNLFAASMNIDMLDMLYKRMDGNLKEQEEAYLSRILSELKMNYLEEKKNEDKASKDKKDTADDPKENIKTESKASGKSEAKATKKKKPATKKSSVKTKDKK